MRTNKRKTFLLVASIVCMLLLGACGKSEEAALDASAVDTGAEEQTEALQEEATDTEADENDADIPEEEGVPWDEMSPVNIKDFPAGIVGSVKESKVFFPNILFPSGCTAADGICHASLDGKEYNAYAYVDTHARTIEDGGGLYFERVGEFIVYTKDMVKDIEIKDTTHNYLIKISVEIWGADDTFKDEYLLKNCEYIKEQIEAMSEAMSSQEDTSTEENIPDDSEFTENVDSDNGGLLEVDRVPCGAYDLDGGGDKYVIVSLYDDDDSGECMLMFRWEGMYGPIDGDPPASVYSDYFDLENIEGNTYRATDWTEKISVTVIFSDGGMDLTGATGELAGYNGHYTCRPED